MPNKKQRYTEGAVWASPPGWGYSVKRLGQSPGSPVVALSGWGLEVGPSCSAGPQEGRTESGPSLLDEEIEGLHHYLWMNDRRSQGLWECVAQDGAQCQHSMHSRTVYAYSLLGFYTLFSTRLRLCNSYTLSVTLYDDAHKAKYHSSHNCKLHVSSPHLQQQSSQEPAWVSCERAGAAEVAGTPPGSLGPLWASQVSAFAGWCPLCTPAHNGCGSSPLPLQRGRWRVAHSSSLGQIEKHCRFRDAGVESDIVHSHHTTCLWTLDICPSCQLNGSGLPAASSRFGDSNSMQCLQYQTRWIYL